VRGRKTTARCAASHTTATALATPEHEWNGVACINSLSDALDRQRKENASLSEMSNARADRIAELEAYLAGLIPAAFDVLGKARFVFAGTDHGRDIPLAELEAALANPPIDVPIEPTP
jgi:hypothetical protein